jgi:glycosyltransferase involved in cell wall biosynthesis
VRLVFITQRVDPDDPVLGATVAKIRALAAICEEVVVLADGAVAGSLPANCRVRTFRARSRAGRGLRFLAALLRELGRRPRPTGVVAHMCPIYAVLAAPLARPAGVRVVLWYAHWSRTRTLRLAARLSTAVASVDTRSVPVESGKVVGIGHGIDVDDFLCADPPAEPRPLQALVLGRYSTAKGLDHIVRGVALARGRGLDMQLRCHGTAGTAGEREHRDALERLVVELGVSDVVLLGGPAPRSEIPELLAGSDVLVNNMLAGAPDKVVYEACASCLPVLVSNPSFDELLGDLEPALRFRRQSAEDLAERLAAVAELSPQARHELGRTLRDRVERRHSASSWAAAMVELCTR